jgi:hypothetical protein
MRTCHLPAAATFAGAAHQLLPHLRIAARSMVLSLQPRARHSIPATQPRIGMDKEKRCYVESVH